MNIAVQAEIEAQLAGLHQMREQLSRDDLSPAMRQLLSAQMSEDIEWLRRKVLPARPSSETRLAPVIRLVQR